MLDPSQNRVARSSMAHSSNCPRKQLSAHRSAQGGAVFDLDYFTCDRCSNEEFLRLLRKVVAHHDVRNMRSFLNALHGGNLVLQSKTAVYQLLTGKGGSHDDITSTTTFCEMQARTQPTWMLKYGPAGDLPVHLAFLLSKRDQGFAMLNALAEIDDATLESYWKQCYRLNAMYGDTIKMEVDAKKRDRGALLRCILNIPYQSDVRWWFNEVERREQKGDEGAAELVRVFNSYVHKNKWDEVLENDVGLFTGETLLHVAIQSSDHELVRWLMQRGARLDASAKGIFFQPRSMPSLSDTRSFFRWKSTQEVNVRSACYYGELPLSFAASIGNIELAKMIMQHAEEILQAREDDKKHDRAFLTWIDTQVATLMDSSEGFHSQFAGTAGIEGSQARGYSAFVNACDSHGNTALHMAVHCDQLEMAEFLLENNATPSLTLMNADQKTPLTAAVRHPAVFNALMLSGFRETVWQYGNSEMTMHSLYQVDSFRVKAAESRSILPFSFSWTKNNGEERLSQEPVTLTGASAATALHVSGQSMGTDDHWKETWLTRKVPGQQKPDSEGGKDSTQEKVNAKKWFKDKGAGCERADGKRDGKVHTKGFQNGRNVGTLANGESYGTVTEADADQQKKEDSASPSRAQTQQSIQLQVADSKRKFMLHAHDGWKSALEIVVEREIHCLEEIPIFEQIINMKWNAFAKRHHILYTILPYMCFFICFNWSVFNRCADVQDAFYGKDSDGNQFNASSLEAAPGNTTTAVRDSIFHLQIDDIRGQHDIVLRLFIDVVVYCVMAPWILYKAWLENRFFTAVLDANEDMIISYMERALYVYKNVPSIMNACIVVFLWVAAGVRLRERHGWFSLPYVGEAESVDDDTGLSSISLELDLLSICCALVWLNLLVIMLPFKRMGQLMLTIYWMFVGDVGRWIMVFLIFLGAFVAGSYVALVMSHRSITDVFLTTTTSRDIGLVQVALQFCYMSAGEVVPGSLVKVARNWQLVNAFNLIFILVVTIMLVNLLVALMGSTFSQHNHLGRQIWWLEFADLVLRYEQRLNRKQKIQFRTGEPVGDPSPDGCCEFHLVAVKSKLSRQENDVGFNLEEESDDETDLGQMRKHVHNLELQMKTLNHRVAQLTDVLTQHMSSRPPTYSTTEAASRMAKVSKDIEVAGLTAQQDNGGTGQDVVMSAAPAAARISRRARRAETNGPEAQAGVDMGDTGLLVAPPSRRRRARASAEPDPE